MQFSDAEIEAEVVVLEKVLDASEFDDAKNVSRATLRLLAIRNLENRVENKVKMASEGPSELIPRWNGEFEPGSIFINDHKPC